MNNVNIKSINAIDNSMKKNKVLRNKNHKIHARLVIRNVLMKTKIIEIKKTKININRKLSHHHGLGRLNIIKMAKLPKLICIFNTIPLKFQADFLAEIDMLI